MSGVWLKSKSGSFRIRDGKGFGAPMKDVGPGAPVFFVELDEDQFKNDAQIEVVAGLPPPKEHEKRLAERVKEAEDRAARAKVSREKKLIAQRSGGAAALAAKRAKEAKAKAEQEAQAKARAARAAQSKATKEAVAAVQKAKAKAKS